MGKDISDGGERRNYVRIDTEVPVRFKISWLNSGKIYSGTTKNISHGGICLEVLQDQDELVESLSSAPEWPTMEIAPLLPDLPADYDPGAPWITSRLDWVKKPSAKDAVPIDDKGVTELGPDHHNVIAAGTAVDIHRCVVSVFHEVGAKPTHDFGDLLVGINGLGSL